MRHRFILAQRLTKVELVEGDFHDHDVGEAFLRMIGTTREWWVVVKRFEREELEQLTALVKLVGIDKVKALFACVVQEDHSDAGLYKAA